MPTIAIQLSQEELDAIVEYAKLCRQTAPDLIRKTIIREITLADGYGSDDPQYDYTMNTPSGVTVTQQRTVIQDNYNRIRRILGWKEIQL